jgi:hypothetical protein
VQKLKEIHWGSIVSLLQFNVLSVGQVPSPARPDECVRAYVGGFSGRISL